MSTTLRDTLQAARIDRTRQRLHAWWHANHCAQCQAKRQALKTLNDVLGSVLASRPEPSDSAPPHADGTHIH